MNGIKQKDRRATEAEVPELDWYYAVTESLSAPPLNQEAHGEQGLAMKPSASQSWSCVMGIFRQSRPNMPAHEPSDPGKVEQADPEPVEDPVMGVAGVTRPVIDRNRGDPQPLPEESAGRCGAWDQVRHQHEVDRSNSLRPQPVSGVPWPRTRLRMALAIRPAIRLSQRSRRGGGCR